MSSSPDTETEQPDPHVDVVIAHSLVSKPITIDSTSARRGWLQSVLDGCLTNHAMRIVVEFDDPGDLIQGPKSSDAIRDQAIKLLAQLLERRKSSPHNSPIIWVGHGVGGTIVKKVRNPSKSISRADSEAMRQALAFVALDRANYADIVASTNLLIFVDCPHRATTRYEIVNPVAQWLSRDVDIWSPVLLRSIDALAAEVIEVNELFLETKIPYSVKVASVYSTKLSSGSSLTQFGGSLGTPDEQVLCLTFHDSFLKAKEVLTIMIEDAKGAQSIDIQNPWFQILSLISPPAQAAFGRPWSNDNCPNWVLQTDVYSKWRNTKGPLAVQLYGTKASDALHLFYEHEKDNIVKDAEKLLLHFTFDSNDKRRNSIMTMATSFITQILSKFEATNNLKEFFRQRWILRAWSLYDAVFALERLTYGRKLVFILGNFDQCDAVSRQQFLDTFSYLFLVTESTIKLLVTTQDILAAWPWESLNTELKGPISSHSDEDRPSDSQIISEDGDVVPSHQDTKSDETGGYPNPPSDNEQQGESWKYVEMLVTDANIPEANVRDVVHLVLAVSDDELRFSLLDQFMGPASIVPVETLLSLENPVYPESFFRHVLDRIPESQRQLIRQVLSWVLCSLRPLSVQELNMAILWIQRREVVDHSIITKRDGIHLLSPIDHLLWGIVVIKNNNVRISHPVLRELLWGSGTEWFRIGEDGHRQIVVSSLELLKQEDFVTWNGKNQGVQCSLEIGDVLIPRSMFEGRTTLHQYITMNWPEHYRRISTSKRPRSEVVDFFQEDSGSAWQSWAESRWLMTNPINRADRSKDSPRCVLSLLAEIGDLEQVKIWTNASSNQSSADTGIALVEASRMGMKDVVEYLLALEPDHPQEVHLQAAMNAAAASADSEVLATLISSAPENFAWPATLLVRVSELGFENCANALLSRGCLPDAPVHLLGTTALAQAISNGHVGICSLLLDYHANVGAIGGSGAIMARAASTCHGEDMIKTLNAHNIDVLTVDEAGISALHESCRLGHFEVTRALADIAQSSNHKPELSEVQDCLQLVADLDFIQTATPVLDILRLYPETQSTWNEQLGMAVENGRVEFARLLLHKGADANCLTESEGHTPLWEACYSLDASLEMLQLLLDNGAEVNSPSRSQTPLMAAARKGRLDFIKYLVERGADVHRPDLCDFSALSEAVCGGSLECVRWLLDNGAEIDWRDEYDESALFEAADANYFEIVHLLLDRGATVSGTG
ncbi:ankyrin repeat [Fusarium albosuccineum]|uniref:Ankyrin repeat n=1 Tax=Fusarium albosuccineum TaxID=1237068 RepID=A0A8H4LBA1_9HYPO|nr:ankyrin repeat [Fusarium albosuccineum]